MHWADQATLDVLRLLGRRIMTMPALAVVTYREEATAGVDGLRLALGDLAGAAGVSRLTLGPLSREAVSTLAADSGVDPGELYERTAGNPFYVTEVLEAGGASVPPTVRDAVLARVAHLGSGSGLAFEVIASAPPVAESWLLQAVAGDCTETVAAGLAAGHARGRRRGDRIPPRDRARGGRALDRAGTAPGAAPQDPRRARRGSRRRIRRASPITPSGAADDDAVVRFAQAAAERAAAVGAHRQAAAQYGRALRSAGSLPAASRAALHELRAEALYAADEQVASIADLSEAIALHRELGDVGAEANATRLLVPRLTCRGLMDEAREAATTAVALLAATPERREYAGALAALAHLHVYEDDLDAAITVGRRAVGIATSFGDTEVRGRRGDHGRRRRGPAGRARRAGPRGGARDRALRVRSRHRSPGR